MNIEEGFLAMLVLFGSVRFSGILSEIGTLSGKMLIYLDHTEMYLHHEFELVEEGLVTIDEAYGHVVTEAVEAVEQVIEQVF